MIAPHAKHWGAAATRPWVRLALAALALLPCAAPGSAGEQAITPEADRLMWCASAFYWLAGSADDAGDAKEAELYDGWASALTGSAAAMMGGLGFDSAQVEEIVAAYDQQVLDEITAGTPRHDVAICQELVEP